METQESWSVRLTQAIAAQVRRQRKGNGWSAQKLSDACAEVGLDFPRSTLADLESGRRNQVSVAELLAMACALGVAPVDLLVPPERAEPIEILPGHFMHPDKAAEWFCSGGTGATVAVLRRKVAEVAQILNKRAVETAVLTGDLLGTLQDQVRRTQQAGAQLEEPGSHGG